MQSRRDQVDAQRYLLGRLTSALVRAEPDALELPTRRDRRGLVAGILAALLMLAGIAIWALLFPGGSTAWRQPGKLLVDSSTGSRFLLVGGELRPVRNVASARLVTGGAVDPVSIGGSKLARLPRGAPVGIAGAPDLLPGAGLNAGVWRACAGSTTADAVRLQIGAVPAVPGRRLDSGHGTLVTDGDRTYLLWERRRLALARPWAADVLGYGDTVPVAVPRAWLDLVPAGPDLAPLDVAGRGSPGPTVGDRPATVGQVFTAPGPGGHGAVHYQLLPDGLTPLSATRAALAEGEAAGTPEQPITAVELASTPRSARSAADDPLPASPPPLRLPAPGEAVCLETASHPDGSTLTPVLAAPPTVTGTPAAGGVSVAVRPGGGALLVARADVAARDQQVALVDGAGLRYPITSDALTALGYQAEQTTVVPARLAGLLPSGPPLDTPKAG
ncbi:conserved hypothetical protein [Frankia canadensis]|uniref:Type VII secretion protein EccB n=1 Tax=Frankia canadensis TaxID=1836972 RepID=A0A2I2KKX8_9ACTN|nr:type VII secretion protein EccB [Frankia canadensis]SNQ46304.1 conserved hypothetical protein [Frankia canadensis]SOU53594.1 conserved hypothetical protein [Frankia canadensis]